MAEGWTDEVKVIRCPDRPPCKRHVQYWDIYEDEDGNITRYDDGDICNSDRDAADD